MRAIEVPSALIHLSRGTLILKHLSKNLGIKLTVENEGKPNVETENLLTALNEGLSRHLEIPFLTVGNRAWNSVSYRSPAHASTHSSRGS